MDPAENLDIWIDETGRVREEHVPALPAPHVVAFQGNHARRLPRSTPPGRSCLLPPPATARNWRLPNSPAGLRPKLLLPRPTPYALRPLHGMRFMRGKVAPTLSSNDRRWPGGSLYLSQCWHCGCCRIACPTGSIAYRFR